MSELKIEECRFLELVNRERGLYLLQKSVITTAAKKVLAELGPDFKLNPNVGWGDTNWERFTSLVDKEIAANYVMGGRYKGVYKNGSSLHWDGVDINEHSLGFDEFYIKPAIS